MDPIFSIPDREKEYQSYMLFVLAILWTIVTSVIVSAGFFYFPQHWMRWVLFLIISLFIATLTLVINRQGHTKTACWTFTLMLWAYITIPCFTSGGIHAPGVLSQTTVILTAGFLLGWRGGLAIGLLTIVADFLMAYAETAGYLPAPNVQHDPFSRWISAIIPFGTILSLQYYATKHLHNSLSVMHREITKREDAEKLKDETLYHFKERVKELKTLYAVSHILRDEDTPDEELFKQIAEALPLGWQFPQITAARVSVGNFQYATPNFAPTPSILCAEQLTNKGTRIMIEVVYLKQMPNSDEGPFLKEERDLINMLAEMVKTDLDRRERKAELKDYKYAIDIAAIVHVSGVDGRFLFVNDNFCKISQYSSSEILGRDHSVLWSGVHSPEYFEGLRLAMQNGQPFRGEFCNKAKDGSLYWVDTSIVPFLDKNGKVYQYLSINQDITERKKTEEKLIESEQLTKKITSQVPGNTYMFEIAENGHTSILFMNRGTDVYNHNYDAAFLKKQPEALREILHEDDKILFNDKMKEAYQTLSNISFQYRILVHGNVRWRWMQAVPEKDKTGKIIWYGATSDITSLVEYITSIEQMLFDIGHVIRRPIASMKGLIKLMKEHELDETQIQELTGKIYDISEEMDKFVHTLNEAYDQKRQNATIQVHIDSTIDKRDSLFL